jgi:hypothetical protein
MNDGYSLKKILTRCDVRFKLKPGKERTKAKEKNVPASGNSDRRRLLLPFASLNGPGEAFGLGPRYSIQQRQQP